MDIQELWCRKVRRLTSAWDNGRKVQSFLPFRKMSLNIKSKEADRLVTEVARLTGESKTEAVIESLRQRLERETRKVNQTRLKGELLMIGEKCASYGGGLEAHGELLYDQDGFPD